MGRKEKPARVIAAKPSLSLPCAQDQHNWRGIISETKISETLR